jgi:hypothetical protein
MTDLGPSYMRSGAKYEWNASSLPLESHGPDGPSFFLRNSFNGLVGSLAATRQLAGDSTLESRKQQKQRSDLLSRASSAPLQVWHVFLSRVHNCTKSDTMRCPHASS